MEDTDTKADDRLKEENKDLSTLEDSINRMLCNEYIKFFHTCKHMQKEVAKVEEQIVTDEGNSKAALEQAKRFVKHVEEETTEKLAQFTREEIILLQNLENTHVTFNTNDPIPTKKSKSWIMNFFFYLIMIVIVVAMFLFSSNQAESGPPRSLFGYAPMTVLTKSMQSEIPKDSLIITKAVEPETIVIGDDITFILENNTTVTHRVIDIFENYQGSRQPGFETQGTDNPLPDADIVYGQNVIGKVIFHNLLIGQILLFIREYMILVFIMCILIMWLVYYLKKYMAMRKAS